VDNPLKTTKSTMKKIETMFDSSIHMHGGFFE